MTARARVALMAAVAAVSLSACGDDDDDDTAQTPAVQQTTAAAGQETTAAAAPEQPAGPPQSLPDVQERLQPAGYEFDADTGETPGVVAQMEISGNGLDGVEVYQYEDVTAARKDYDAIRKVYAKLPGRGIVRISDTRVYSYGEERKLTTGETEAFNKLYAAAEE